MDDATRLAYVEVLSDEKAANCTAFLRRAIVWYERHGIRVRSVMTDNYRPQTNGKAERFIQTMLREWAYATPYRNSAYRTAALQPWLAYYNRNRPHGSLDDQSPFSNLRRRREQRV